MEKGDMPNDPWVHVIPPKAEVDPLHPGPCPWGCCAPAPGQPSLLSFRLPKCRICPFWFPAKSPSGAAWAGGDSPKPRGLCAWGSRLLRLV